MCGLGGFRRLLFILYFIKVSSSQHYTHFIDKLLYLNCIKYIGLKTCNKYTVQKSWVTLPSSQMFSRFFKTGLDKHQAWLETFAQYCTQLTLFICKAAILQLLSNNHPETLNWPSQQSDLCQTHPELLHSYLHKVHSLILFAEWFVVWLLPSVFLYSLLWCPSCDCDRWLTPVL